MANKVINIATKYNEGLVVNLDKSDFFRLGKDSCQRGELFNFALALGVHQGYPSEIDKRWVLFEQNQLVTINTFMSRYTLRRKLKVISQISIKLQMKMISLIRLNNM